MSRARLRSPGGLRERRSAVRVRTRSRAGFADVRRFPARHGPAARSRATSRFRRRREPCARSTSVKRGGCRRKAAGSGGPRASMCGRKRTPVRRCPATIASAPFAIAFWRGTPCSERLGGAGPRSVRESGCSFCGESGGRPPAPIERPRRSSGWARSTGPTCAGSRLRQREGAFATAPPSESEWFPDPWLAAKGGRAGASARSRPLSLPLRAGAPRCVDGALWLVSPPQSAEPAASSNRAVHARRAPKSHGSRSTPAHRRLESEQRGRFLRVLACSQGMAPGGSRVELPAVPRARESSRPDGRWALLGAGSPRCGRAGRATANTSPVPHAPRDRLTIVSTNGSRPPGRIELAKACTPERAPLREYRGGWARHVRSPRTDVQAASEGGRWCHRTSSSKRVVGPGMLEAHAVHLAGFSGAVRDRHGPERGGFGRSELALQGAARRPVPFLGVLGCRRQVWSPAFRGVRLGGRTTEHPSWDRSGGRFGRVDFESKLARGR